MSSKIKLKAGLKKLNLPSGRYFAGREYEKATIPAAALEKYFGQETLVEEKITIVEKPVPVFGAMSEEQLNQLNKDHLLILAVQHNCEGVTNRTSNEDLITAILAAQEAEAAANATKEDGDE